MYLIVLASESPRRKEIMDQMGIGYVAIPSHAKEVVSETSPSDMVKALASLKARDVASRLNVKEKFIIIGVVI